MSSTYHENFTSSFQLGNLSFSHLFSVARTSDTMLNRSVKSGNPCLAPDFS